MNAKEKNDFLKEQEYAEEIYTKMKELDCSFKLAKYILELENELNTLSCIVANNLYPC